jgi:glycosyltransferase involved in cell wall biosynthesis
MVNSIAHVILEPRYSGAEILVLNLVRSQLEKGIASSVVAMRPSHPNFECEMKELEKLGCRVAVPPHSLKRRQRASWIYRALQQIKPEIVFAHASVAMNYARLAALPSGIPVVSVLHSACDDYANRKAWFAEKILCKRNAALVGVSQKNIDEYNGHIGTSRRTRLIPNGIDLNLYAGAIARRAEVRRSLLPDGSGDQILILQVGRISDSKRQCISAEAVARINRDGLGSPITLLFAGLTDDAEYLQRIRRIVHEQGAENQIKVLGDRRDVPELLAAADIYLMPSRHEAHSLAAMESLASGVYSIFSGIDAFRPFTTLPGVTLVDECNTESMTRTLQGVIASGDYRKRFTRDLRRYSKEECFANYLKLANEICGADSEVLVGAGA